MKTILLLSLLLAASHSFADTFKLKETYRTFPTQDPELTKIWEECINQATEVTFASGYAYLSNQNPNCSKFGLDNVPFKQDGQSYYMELPAGTNPFSKLKNAKVTLYAAYNGSLSDFRLDVRSQFVSAFRLDVRLSTTRDGIPYDYFISRRSGVEGWQKIDQVLLSTETRTDWCRPNIQCTSIIKTYEQTWKDTRNGRITKLKVSES